MERKKFFTIYTAIAIIAIILMVGIPKSPTEEPENPKVQVDFCASPIQNIDQLENGTIWVPYKSHVVQPELESEMAGDKGNLYAPDIIIENGVYMMWYGAQSSTGHDSIHFATSDNGREWNKYGTVIETGENNHVNDPSVVKVDDTYYMYYTVAPVAELDEIWVATSSNGINWTIEGMILNASKDAEQWDSLKVGRPTVIYRDNEFKMWFDGSQRNATEPTKVREGSGRHVGYANSSDGLTWTKYANNPVFNHSGAIDVEYLDNKYVVVEESGNGVYYRNGTSEIDFPNTNKLLFKKTGTSFDKYGHVTPFILVKGNKWVATYTGAATDSCWCRNRISVWYPMQNITLNQVQDSEEQAITTESTLQPWALSNNMIQWTLSVDSYEAQYSLELYFKGELYTQITIKIENVLEAAIYSNLSLIIIYY